MFAFLRTTEVLEFANSVVAEYDRLQRSVAARHDTQVKRRQRFDKLLQKIDAYSRDNKLNFYKKSRMLQLIRHGLGEKGIPDSEIDDFMNALLTMRLLRR